jgi:hypothetical protein
MCQRQLLFLLQLTFIIDMAREGDIVPNLYFEVLLLWVEVGNVAGVHQVGVAAGDTVHAA